MTKRERKNEIRAYNNNFKSPTAVSDVSTFGDKELVTSYKETGSFAHLHKRSEQHHVISNSWFDLHSPSELNRCLRKQHDFCPRFVYEEAC